jgi:hypothetical protein
VDLRVDVVDVRVDVRVDVGVDSAAAKASLRAAAWVLHENGLYSLLVTQLEQAKDTVALLHIEPLGQAWSTFFWEKSKDVSMILGSFLHRVKAQAVQ